MIINSLNLNHVRVFNSVYRSASMTAAAKELHMTQSGVSQHIKSLEDMLGVRLFDRIKQRLVPTSAGTTLYQSCSTSLTSLEETLTRIKGGGKELAGVVTIGMPIEFGNNVILPLLSKFSRKHPGVTFKIRLGFASTMNDALLRGEMDFAFVDAFTMDRKIRVEPVYDEVLELCISEELLKTKGPIKHAREFYESLDYVEYQEGAPVLRIWLDHHLKGKPIRIRARATVMDVQSVARLIQGQMGAGILPGHLVAELERRGSKLHRFKGCGKPVKNAISLAYLVGRTQAPAAASLLEWLRNSLKLS